MATAASFEDDAPLIKAEAAGQGEEVIENIDLFLECYFVFIFCFVLLFHCDKVKS